MKREIKWWQVIALVILFTGAYLTIWFAQQQDLSMRNDLFIKTNFAKTGVSDEKISALTGNSSDLALPEYQTLKIQLQKIRMTDPAIRFTYLMGQKQDGTIIFYADSEPPESEDYSPPGQEYTEASPAVRSVFTTGNAVVEGPYTDRWGTWVSGLVPVTDPATGRVVAVFGMDIDARNWNFTIVKACAAIIATLVLILVIIVTFGLFQQQEQREQRLLKASEEKFSRAFHANPMPMAVTTIEEGRVLDANRSFLEALGYSRDEVIGRTTSDLDLYVDPAQRDVIIRQLKERSLVRDVDVKVRKKNHDILYGLFSAMTIDVAGRPHLLSVIHDVTEHKKAEELLFAEHELAFALASATSLKDVLPLCLATAVKLSGMDSGGIYLVRETTGDLELAYSLGLSDEFVNETTSIKADSDSARLVLSGKPIYSQYLTLGVPVTGTRAQEKLRAIAIIPIFSKNRVIACFNIASHTCDSVPDQSRTSLESIAALIGNGIARFMAEEATRASEEHYRTLFEGAAEGILVADIATEKFLYANTAISMMLGYSQEELTSMELKDIHPVKDLDVVRKEFQSLARGEKKSTTDIPCLKKDKTIIYTEIVSSKILIDNRLCNVGFFTDITERKRMEDTLQRANLKLNVISQLTRKNLTNQIFIFSSYLELTKNQLAGQDRILETLQKGERALQAIRQIIEYSKDYQDMGAKPPKWQNVTMAMLFGLSHISIGKIQHSFETEDIEIFADSLLEKVCQLLIENSVKHGDHVTRIRVWHTVTPDGITIMYEDDGIGIPQEIKEQIFLRDESGTYTLMRSLIFVREILDITGIKIRETGIPGIGARFEIIVPKEMWRTVRKSE